MESVSPSSAANLESGRQNHMSQTTSDHSHAGSSSRLLSHTHEWRGVFGRMEEECISGARAAWVMCASCGEGRVSWWWVGRIRMTN